MRDSLFSGSLSGNLLSMASGPEAIIVLAGFSAFLSVIVLWQALRLGDTTIRRARSILEREASLRRAALAPGHHASRRFLPAGLMARVVARLRLMQGSRTRAMRERLAQAGLRSREALIVFLFCKLTLPLAFGIGAILVFEVLRLYPLPATGRSLAALGCVLFGAWAPDLWVKNRIEKRRQAMTLGLPDALDLLVICVEAGLSLDAAMKRSAGELGLNAPELADEFHLTSVELGFLPDRAEALRNLAARTGIKPVAGMVGALLQTEKFGTPVALSLRVLAAEFRSERLLRAEEKAARLPATLTVPMVIFILPVLFIVLIGPAALTTIDSLKGL